MNFNTPEIEKGIKILNSGGIIAIPTETVYGLAGNAFDENAIQKIYDLKNRPLYNPLIVHIGAIEDLNKVAIEIPEIAFKLIEAFWPGPLTLVLKKHPAIKDIVTSGNQSVAVRMPNHQLTLHLLNQLEFPLAAPSANKFGNISPTSAAHVQKSFKNEVPYILDGGECAKGIESTIIGFENGEPILYRYGSIATEDIEKVCGKLKINHKEEVAPIASGMLAKHYAPLTKTYLSSNVQDFVNKFEGKKIGLLLFKQTLPNLIVAHQEVLSTAGDLVEAAKNLYAAMHKLDHLNLDVIIAEQMPNVGIGQTINDRLERASK